LTATAQPVGGGLCSALWAEVHLFHQSAYFSRLAAHIQAGHWPLVLLAVAVVVVVVVVVVLIVVLPLLAVVLLLLLIADVLVVVGYQRLGLG
jgi:hypothetical protein